LHSALRLHNVPSGHFEDGREPLRVTGMTGYVLDPGPAGAARPGERRRLAAAQLFFRDVRRELHDEAIVHQADEHAPAGVTGRTPEHLADAEAAMMLDEMGEKRLKIRSKRNRHGAQRL
jgi:hypothetical protein